MNHKIYYKDENVTIINGESQIVLPELGHFDLLLTDPPYNVDFAGKTTKHSKGTESYIGGDNDNGPLVVSMALEKCKRGIVFTGNKMIFDYPKPSDIGCVYCPSGAGTGPWGFICFHAVLYYGKRPGGPKSPSSMVSNHRAEDNGHPCPKPLEWMKWAIAIGSDENDTIVDPFGGSGTTARAAKDMNRKCVIIEKEEVYCEIAAKRMQQMVLL